MGLRDKIARLRRDTSGASLIEMTLVAPLLIALMCGLAEFGQALRQYHTMHKGVRDAARYLASVPANPACSGVPDPTPYAWADAIADAKRLAVYGSTNGSTPIFKGWTSTATVQVEDDECEPNPRGPTALPLPRIRVVASAPYTDLGMLSAIGAGPITISVQHEQLKVY